MAILSSRSTAENAENLRLFKSHRTHTASDPLRRVLGWLFYAYVWIELLWVWLDSLPVRLVIPLGSSQLRETDLVVFAFLAVWGGRAMLHGHSSRKAIGGSVYGIVFLLLIPVLIGLAVGKPLGTVLRDVRVPLYYATMLPMLVVLRNHTDLHRLQRFIMFIGFVSMLSSIGLWLASRFTSAAESMVQRYGFGSLNVLGTWLLFIAVASVLFGDAGLSRKRWAGVLVVLGLIQTYVVNDVRSTYVGVLGGLLFLACVPWLWSRRSRLPVGLRQRWLKWGIVVSGLLLVLMFSLGLAMAWSGLNVRDIVGNNMTLRRFYSLVDPTIEEYGLSNREDRLVAVSYGLEIGFNNYGLGLGYGDNSFVNLDENQIYGLIQRNRIEGNPGNIIEGLLFFHNSFAWVFGRLGLWLALIYFFLVLVLFVRAWRAAYQAKLTGLRVFTFATLAFVIYTLISGFGGGGFFSYLGPGMAFWLIALAVLIRSTALMSEG